jgi:DNA-binding transcriptional ArsR family regulator
MSSIKDPQRIKMLFWSVFAGSKGCINRVRIILELKNTTLNTNQLSERLGLDYKVVERHLEILERNNLVAKAGYRYGAVYYLCEILHTNMIMFTEVATKAQHCKENLQLG